ncbi:MAG: hypothetical protein FWE06_09245 [Oscillospiraceae bacterium]|nr:hypothetical protein [Oscillospiraceae bacterium]
MKSTILFLVKMAAILAIVSTAVVLIVKYLDTIVACFQKIKGKICSIGGGCCDSEIAYDDIDLEDICLDPACPCE